MTESTELSSRPAIVSKAVKLLYATLGIGVLYAVLKFQALAQHMPVLYILFVWAVVFGAMGFLIHEIGARQNWARVVSLIVFIAGLPFAIPPLLHSLIVAPVYGLLGLLQILGLVIALVMLFLGASNEWFREPTTSK